MTKEEAIGGLRDLPKHDTEMAHAQADEILIEFLASNGYSDITDVYDEIKEYHGGFWYA